MTVVKSGMRIELEVKVKVRYVSEGWDRMLAQCPLSRLEVVQVTCREWVTAALSKVLLAGRAEAGSGGHPELQTTQLLGWGVHCPCGGGTR